MGQHPLRVCAPKKHSREQCFLVYLSLKETTRNDAGICFQYISEYCLETFIVPQCLVHDFVFFNVYLLVFRLFVVIFIETFLLVNVM